MVKPPYFLGIDVGSLSCDGALLDYNGNLLSTVVQPTGISGVKAAEKVRSELLSYSRIVPEQIGFTVSTGYGRERVNFADKAVTEITCHGRGANFFFSETRAVIDIGGQDSKAIKVDFKGRVVDFIMNDRCAAGTGRFLEVMARALEMDLIEMGPLSLKATGNSSISSICTVFAESEVVSLLAKGTPIDHIVHGLHASVAKRTAGLLYRIKPLPADPITLSGGVVLNPGVVQALEVELGKKLLLPENPQIVGAVGASLIAREKYLKEK